ncbi:hypothetical protein ASD10_12340 [Aeromicrobium sp. Root472D3]|nr:hypothetical protein ASF38_14760 [Aeromicrobium sp. Leaf272]KQX76545.1 hypothetical protein ASD10_12340 [Aeromicrobium sp. Root472D3]
MHTSVLEGSDVVAAVDQGRATDAVRAVLRAAARGEARPIAKSMAAWDDRSTAHTLGAVDESRGLVAFKSWVNTPAGASALLSLFDARTGAVLAVMDAGQLGAFRTAATAAVATDLLAAPEANVLTVLGSGRQAFQQATAVSLVRPLEAIRVWSRTPANRQAFAVTLERELGLRVDQFDDARDAVDGSPIVTAVTRAADPFLAREWLAPGAHVNAVGAILPSAAELLPGVVEAGSLVVVDDLENARRASKELKDALGDDLAGTVELGRLLEDGVGRPDQPALTVFKGMGSGLCDLAVAALVLDRQEVGA